MDKHWVRKIVNNWYRTITAGQETTILLLTPRQDRFLHLQRQCYWDCGLCEEEAIKMKELEETKEVTFIDFDEEWGMGPGVWSCNNCGAHAEKVEDIKHHKGCTPGESKKWEKFYSEQGSDDICPKCGAPLTNGNNMSGVKCTKCDYWFCY